MFGYQADFLLVKNDALVLSRVAPIKKSSGQAAARPPRVHWSGSVCPAVSAAGRARRQADGDRLWHSVLAGEQLRRSV
jgi:hypothetical protein